MLYPTGVPTGVPANEWADAQPRYAEKELLYTQREAQPGLNVNPMFVTQRHPVSDGNAADRTATIDATGPDGERLRMWIAYNEPSVGTHLAPNETPALFTPNGALVCRDEGCVVNIRSRPDIGAAIACKGPNGTPGETIRSAGPWVNVDFSDCIGWVNSDYFQYLNQED